jgi:hypothetical protein
MDIVNEMGHLARIIHEGLLQNDGVVHDMREEHDSCDV